MGGAAREPLVASWNGAMGECPTWLDVTWRDIARRHAMCRDAMWRDVMCGDTPCVAPCGATGCGETSCGDTSRGETSCGETPRGESPRTPGRPGLTQATANKAPFRLASQGVKFPPQVYDRSLYLFVIICNFL